MLKEEIIMRGKQLGFPRLSKKSHDNQATMIATIVQEAIEAEREACIGDIQMHIPRSGRDTLEYKMAMRMIERIRARGEPTSRGEA